jgi:large subunit ribosomal protein L18
MSDSKRKYLFRKKRVRSKISGTSSKPRLSVYRGHKHIYAQLIDDEKGHTMAYVSTLSQELKGKMKSTDNMQAAIAVGELIGDKAGQIGIKKVVFDRGGYIYAGRIKALADAARKKGLEF